MPNLELVAKDNLSSFRRIAIGTWATTYDPSVYGGLTLRMDETIRYLEAFRAATGRKLTLTHMFARAMAAVLEKMPDANAILRWNRIYLRQNIGVFFQVAMEDPVTGQIDLSGAKVDEPQKKTLVQIVDEFQKATTRVRSGKDKELEGTRSTFKKIPYFLLNRVLKLISFFSFTLNLDLRWAGIPKDPFGSVMITNIGSLKLDEAYVPLVPYSRVPLLLAVGEVKETPFVENGKVIVAKTLRVGATFDHRVLDGSHAAVMSKVMREWMEHPFEHFDKIEAAKEEADRLKAEAPKAAEVAAVAPAAVK